MSTSPCDVCGKEVPVPKVQRLGWVDGHLFDFKHGQLILMKIRCKKHLHETDPSFKPGGFEYPSTKNLLAR